MDYVLTSPKSKKYLATKSYKECFDFIIKYPNVTIRTIDYQMKPKVLARPKFLEKYLDITHNYSEFFTLFPAIIKLFMRFFAN